MVVGDETWWDYVADDEPSSVDPLCSSSVSCYVLCISSFFPTMVLVSSWWCLFPHFLCTFMYMLCILACLLIPLPCSVALPCPVLYLPSGLRPSLKLANVQLPGMCTMSGRLCVVWCWWYGFTYLMCVLCCHLFQWFKNECGVEEEHQSLQ